MVAQTVAHEFEEEGLSFGDYVLSGVFHCEVNSQRIVSVHFHSVHAIA